MACDFGQILGQVPYEWREARAWLDDLRVQFGAYLEDIDQVRVVRCGMPPPFNYLWSDCVTIPNPAFVLDFCEYPRAYYWNGSAWAGPVPLGAQNNEIRIVPEGTALADYNSYFNNSVPESTGSVVIEEGLARRRYWRYHNNTRAEFGKQTSLFGYNAAPTGNFVTNGNFNPFLNLSPNVFADDLIHFGWDFSAVALSPPNTITITIIVGTLAFTYTGLNSVQAVGNSYLLPSGSYLQAFNPAYYMLFFHSGATNIQVTTKYMWVSLIRKVFAD